MSEAALQLAGLTRSFRQGGAEIEVLRGVDLTLARGEIVALLGWRGRDEIIHRDDLVLAPAPSGGAGA